MSAQSDLSELLERLVTEQTFSMDVLDKIKNLKDAAKKAADENESLKKKIDSLSTESSQRYAELSVANNKIAEYSKREAEVSAQQRENELLRLKLELISGFKFEMKEIVMAAFRNTEIRQDMFGSLPVSVSGGPTGCGFVGQGSTSVTTTVKPE